MAGGLRDMEATSRNRWPRASLDDARHWACLLVAVAVATAVFVLPWAIGLWTAARVVVSALSG